MGQQYIEVELGGKVRLLRFDYNAICDIEEKFGKGVAAIFTEEQIGFNLVRLFYWAGFRWKEPGLTVQRVGQMLYEQMQEGRDMQELMKPIMRALKQSKMIKMTDEVGNEEEPEEGNDQARTD